MKKIVLLLVSLLLLFFPYSVQSLGGGATDHLQNPSPGYGERDVDITAKGVQTCIDVVVDSGCVANVTFWWFNYSEGDWGQWEFYGNTSGITTNTTVCFWNPNISCATENWFTEYSHWMVVGNFTCGGQYDYQERAYLWFLPEDCPLFYIYPPWNDTNICPCASAMCLGIANVEGHSMNLTFYRNDTMNETFYVVNRYVEVSNGTYCFCLDGHIDDIYYPMKYNESYHWYVNITDTVSGDYNISQVFNFTTVENISDCPCGLDEIIEVIDDTDYIRDDSWLIGLIIVFSVLSFVFVRRK